MLVLVLLLFTFKVNEVNNRSDRDLGEARASYERYIEPVQLMPKLARGEI